MPAQCISAWMSSSFSSLVIYGWCIIKFWPVAFLSEWAAVSAHRVLPFTEASLCNGRALRGIKPESGEALGPFGWGIFVRSFGWCILGDIFRRYFCMGISWHSVSAALHVLNWRRHYNKFVNWLRFMCLFHKDRIWGHLDMYGGSEKKRESKPY